LLYLFFAKNTFTYICGNGQSSLWYEIPTVTRYSGSATVTIPANFGETIYPAIKFRSTDDLKGTFRFPQGTQPVTIMRS
jgi:hypothetical protein